MGALYPEEIRAAVAERVRSIGAPLRLSLEPYEFLRSATHSPVHGEFAVGVPSTIPLGDTRQRVATHATTEVAVLSAWQVNPKDRITSSDAMLALSRQIRNHLLVRGWRDHLTLMWTRSEHSAGIDGWLWHEHSFSAHHALPLQ